MLRNYTPHLLAIFSFTLVACSGSDPAEKRLWVDARVPASGRSGDKVRLVGERFGTKPGTVRVGATQVKILSWDNSNIEWEVPQTDFACADITVTGADGAMGNPLPFTVNSPDSWVRHTEDPGQPMPHAFWTGKELLLIGWATAEIYRYNPRSDSWIVSKDFPNFAKLQPKLVTWTGTELLVFGVLQAQEVIPLGMGYDPATDTWRHLSVKDAPDFQYAMSAIWSGSEMIVWGGTHCESTTSCENPRPNGGRFDPDQDQWIAMSDGIKAPANTFDEPQKMLNARQSRVAHSAVWTGSEMIIWGGILGEEPLRDGARYDPASNTWKPIAETSFPFPGIEAFTATWFRGELVVFGMAEGHWQSAAFSPAADTWRIFPNPFPDVAPFTNIILEYVQAFSAGDRLLVQSSTRRYESDDQTEVRIATFNASEGAWHAGPQSIPMSRAAAWAGEEFISWGVMSGLRYSPSSGKVVPMASNHEGDDFYYYEVKQRGTWTGSEWVFVAPSPLETNSPVPVRGQSYNPATNMWKAIPDAPESRSMLSTASVNGSVFLWGGVHPTASIEGTWATGGLIYRPATQSWKQFPAGVSAPAPTAYPGLAAMDGKLVALGNTNIGGILDPQTLQWTQFSFPEAATNYHGAAFWTGSEVIRLGRSERKASASNQIRAMAYNPALKSGRILDSYPAGLSNSFVWTQRGKEIIGVYGDTVATLNTETGTWRQKTVTGLPPSMTQASSHGKKTLLTHQGALFLFGVDGDNQDGVQDGVRKVFRLDVDAGVAVPLGERCGRRPLHTAGFFMNAVAVGDRIITWDGQLGADYYP